MAKKSHHRLNGNPFPARLAISQLSVPVLCWDVSYIITECNPAFLRLTGYDRAEIVGRTVDQLFPPSDRAKMMRLLRRNLTANRTFEADIPLYGKYTQVIPTHWDIGAIHREQSDRHLFTVAYIHDSTRQKKTEKELVENRDMFKVVVDSSPLAVYVAEGMDLRGTYMNRRFTELFGYTLRDIPSADDWFPRAYPDPAYRTPLVNEWKRRVARVYRTGKPMKPMEATATCKDGTQKHVLWSFVSVGERNISYGLDMTDRFQAERAQASSERKFRRMFENSPINTALVDLEGKIHMVNKAAVRMGGFRTKKELVGKNILAFVDPAYHSKVDEGWQQIRKKGAVYDMEVAQIAKDGSRLHTLASGVMLHGVNGRPENVIVMVQDITQSRKVREELRIRKELYKSQAIRLQAILDSTPAVIWIAMDPSCREIIGNKKAYEFSKVRQGTNLSKSGNPQQLRHYQVYHNGILLKAADMPIQRAAASRKPLLDYEMDFVFSDGARHTLAGNVIPVFGDHGTPAGAVAAFIDISDRKRMEKRKDDFISIASHELKTPLTSVKAYGQILKKRLTGKAPAETLAMLDRMDGQINKLAGLVADMLDVSKIQSGTLELRRSTFSIDMLIEEAVRDMQVIVNSEPRTRRGPYRFLFAKRSGAEVSGDKYRLAQVVNNLLINAVKYSPRSRRVVIKTKKTVREVVVSVQDYGQGISAEKQQHLFERFYRLSDRRENHDRFTSLGLGLYISSNIIRQHGGRIWAKSTVGKGSTFCFAIPLSGRGKNYRQ